MEKNIRKFKIKQRDIVVMKRPTKRNKPKIKISIGGRRKGWGERGG